MARKDIVNGLSYNQGFNNANDNFIDVYQQIDKFTYNKSFNETYANFRDANIQGGTYRIYSSTMQNPPFAGVVAGLVDVRRSAAGEIYIEFRPWDSNDVHYLHYANGTWIGWEKNATDKQPNWITATLMNGWTGDAYYRKNQIGQLELLIDAKPGTTANNTIITILPIGYRPSYYVPITTLDIATGKVVNSLGITAAGEIYIIDNAGIGAGHTLVGRLVICG